jgi:hypothetical protein
LRRELGFDGLQNIDVRELLNSRSEELTDDDLLLLDNKEDLKKSNVMLKNVIMCK